MNLIGIDPGISGGITVIDKNGAIKNKYIMPIIKSAKGKNEIDIKRVVDIFENARPIKMIGIERQQAFQKQGVSSTFKTGRGFGILEGIAAGMKIPYMIIGAKIWQKKMFEGMGKSDTKQLSKIIAQRLYPNEDFRATERCTKIHDGITDSLAIALFLLNQ